jgi:toxin ParE1/3/4
MKGRLIIRPRVYLDLDEIAEHIQKDNPRAALRFLENAEATFESLAEMPGLGARYRVRNPRLPDLRRFSVKGFRKYLVFYQPVGSAIEIVRVLHGSRNLAAILRRQS